MPPVDDFIGWFFKVSLGAVLALFGWLFKAEKSRIDDHAKEISMLKSSSVSEDKVREIIRETVDTALIPMREDLQEIKRVTGESALNIKQMEIEMARQEGYRKAEREMKGGSN